MKNLHQTPKPSQIINKLKKWRQIHKNLQQRIPAPASLEFPQKTHVSSMQNVNKTLVKLSLRVSI